MGRIRVVWASEDLDYIERLLHYVRSSEEQLDWHFHTFSDAQLCQKFLTSTSNIDLLVVDADWSEEISTESIPTAILSDVSSGTADHTLFKYQPLPKLLEAMQSISGIKQMQSVEFAAPAVHDDTSLARTPTVISIFSAAGGTGKTMMALQMLKLASAQNLRTFYLNLELIPAAEAMGCRLDGDDVFARLLYYLQSDSERIEDEWKQSIKQHEALRFDYIPAFHHLINRLELGAKEVEMVMNLLIQSSDYDLIVLDLDTVAHESTMAALTLCDRVIWVVTDDIQCLEKTNTALRELSFEEHLSETIQEKSVFVLNKYTGSIVNESIQSLISFELPYIPEWKSVSTLLSLEDEQFYMQKLKQLMNECIVQRASEAVVGSELR